LHRAPPPASEKFGLVELTDKPPSQRRAQREHTEERILASARARFARFGYSATTVRAIADDAGTDAALVMRYFGSKAELFSRTADLAIDESPKDPKAGAAAEFLASLKLKLDSEPASLLAGLRSLLSHPTAGMPVTVAMRGQQSSLAEGLGGADAELRAGLLGAMTVGIVMARYVLELDGVRDADSGRLLTLIEPYVDQLVDGGSRPLHKPARRKTRSPRRGDD
jgi:AcrR family transcriptional regulator